VRQRTAELFEGTGIAARIIVWLWNRIYRKARMAHVHIIDNEKHLREVLRLTLEDAGYEVSESTNGIDGLKWVKQNLPDLVLCDVMMPELSGFEVLRELRNDPATVDIPFIYLTGQGDRDERRAGMNLGANDFMTKPFAQKDLVAAIESRLGQRARELVKHEKTINNLRKNITYALPHELRTPLTHILGYSRFIMTQAESTSVEDMVDMAGSIYRAGERLNHLFENYLAIAQLDLIAAKQEDVQKLRNNVLKNAADVIVEIGSRLARKYDRVDDLIFEVSGNVVRMSHENFARVVEELIDNAFKFSEAGTQILIKAVRKDNRYLFFIRDHGHGMTSEQIGSIGAYMQFERALYEQQGLGLGFCLAKRIVTLHGGEFEVKSQPGHGTGILLTIPD